MLFDGFNALNSQHAQLRKHVVVEFITFITIFEHAICTRAACSKPSTKSISVEYVSLSCFMVFPMHISLFISQFVWATLVLLFFRFFYLSSGKSLCFFFCESIEWKRLH